MAAIIRDLPFDERPASLQVGARSVAILPYQPVVWVTLAARGTASFDPRTPRVPAVLDLGFNGTFAIREELLHAWAGLDPRLFPKVRDTRLRGAPAEERLANLFLHPNVPGTRNPSPRVPFLLELPKGILILGRPDGASQSDYRPRLPLVGVHALHQADLKLLVDCGRCRLSVYSARRFCFFG